MSALLDTKPDYVPDWVLDRTRVFTRTERLFPARRSVKLPGVAGRSAGLRPSSDSRLAALSNSMEATAQPQVATTAADDVPKADGLPPSTAQASPPLNRHQGFNGADQVFNVSTHSPRGCLWCHSGCRRNLSAQQWGYFSETVCGL